MNKSLNYCIIIALLILMVTSSCKKYPEGPRFSLNSKTERVANTWMVENAWRNGVDITSDYAIVNYTEFYDKNGIFSWSSGNGTGAGKWEFQNDKNEIKRFGIHSQKSETLVILKLKQKKFWYYYFDGNDKTEIHLMEK